jgi:hypothetical protein
VYSVCKYSQSPCALARCYIVNGREFLSQLFQIIFFIHRPSSLSPRKMANSHPSGNMFNFLWDSSPAPTPTTPGGRSRSVSQKRKNSDNSGNTGPSYANVVCSESSTGNTPVGVLSEEKAIELAKVKSICDQVAVSIGESNADPAVLGILSNINTAISGLCNIVGTPPPIPPQQNNSGMVVLGTIPKKSRVENNAASSSQNQRVGRPVPAPIVISEPDVPPEMQRFRDTVKDAERATLVFNLNMGPVPIMNVDTMSKKATLALTSMVAKVEKKTTSMPSSDTVALIDDVLSVSSGIKFFGATTKTYRKNGDPQSGLFCTVPVRYEFPDKDTKIRAETILRKTCNANCTTPYPNILRECIRRTIDHVKQERPDSFVKVNVDPVNFCLKVAWKPKGSETAPWNYAREHVPLPKEALDVRSRTVPETLTINMPVFTPTKSSPRAIEVDADIPA